MAGKSTTGATEKKTPTETPEAPVSEAKVTEVAVPDKEPAVVADKNIRVPKAFDANQIVVVRNGFQGKLVYKSKKTGEKYIWDEFNAEQDMEISELKSARSASKKYFINNWFMFDDPEIIDYLGVTQYYKFALTIKEFDKLFDKSADEITNIVRMLSDGQRNSVIYRAKQLIADGVIDSNKKISALEDCLGVELVER